MGKKIRKIYIDRDACISAGTCIVEAPKAFDFDEDEIAILLPGAEDVDDEKLYLAAQSCPTQAIILYDENDIQIFPKK